MDKLINNIIRDLQECKNHTQSLINNPNLQWTYEKGDMWGCADFVVRSWSLSGEEQDVLYTSNYMYTYPGDGYRIIVGDPYKGMHQQIKVYIDNPDKDTVSRIFKMMGVST